MKSVAILIILSIQLNLSWAQTNIIQFPQRLSIIPRNTLNNYAKVYFELTNSSESLILKKFKNGNLISNTLLKADTIGSDHFYFVDSIEAGLNNYGYELWKDNSKRLRSADSICAGDIYIINGQSNAESATKGESTYYLQNSFIRTYGNGSISNYSKTWFIASGDGTKDNDGHIGQLGVAIASYLINEKKIPICIMNGAEGGQAISYFLRDESNRTNMNTNYGRLYIRLNEIHATQNVRAIIWYQGEKDADLRTSYEDYKTKLNSLYNAWKEDYSGIENIYLFQIKHGCWQDKKYTGTIQQAQFDFALSDSNIHLISTNYIDHHSDSCHFNFHNGYQVLGYYVYLLMNYYQYRNLQSNEIFSLHIKQIQKVNEYQINIILNQKETIFVDQNSKNDFTLNLNDEMPIDIYNHEDTISLIFQNKIPDNYQLSYIGHSGNRYPAITNQYGQGLTSFYNQGESTFNWHLPNNILQVSQFPQLQYHEIEIDSYNSFLDHYTLKDGFYFYTFQNELVVESSKDEICKLNLEIYDAFGRVNSQMKQNVFRGRNRFKLPIEKSKIYLLHVQVNGKNSVASKKMKLIY